MNPVELLALGVGWGALLGFIAGRATARPRTQTRTVVVLDGRRIRERN